MAKNEVRVSTRVPVELAERVDRIGSAQAIPVKRPAALLAVIEYGVAAMEAAIGIRPEKKGKAK